MCDFILSLVLYILMVISNVSYSFRFLDTRFLKVYELFVSTESVLQSNSSALVMHMLMSTGWRCCLTVELITTGPLPTAEPSHCKNQMFIPLKWLCENTDLRWVSVYTYSGSVLAINTQMTALPIKVSTESFPFLGCWLCLSAVWVCLQLPLTNSLDSLLRLKIASS